MTKNTAWRYFCAAVCTLALGLVIQSEHTFLVPLLLFVTFTAIALFILSLLKENKDG